MQLTDNLMINSNEEKTSDVELLKNFAVSIGMLVGVSLVVEFIINLFV
jgi:hypothetical protein